MASKNHKVFYMEKRNYKELKCYKSYTVKIDKTTKEFKNKVDLLYYLKELV